jgi:heptosyltransferase-2
MKFRGNCRHFLGDRPCAYGGQCGRCKSYQPWRERWLIIKMAAKGDVLRTTPLARAIKQTCSDARVTWLTDSDALPLLRHNPHIDRLLPYQLESLVQLGSERFDRLICLDKETRAVALAMSVEAKRKHGFGWDPRGFLIPLDVRAEYLFRMGLSNELKFKRNRKSYQQMVVEAAGLEYNGQGYHYTVTTEESKWASAFLRKMFRAGDGRPWIGINTGTGRAYPTKAWTTANLAGLARGLRKSKLGTPVILGGPAEKETVSRIRRLCPGIPAIPTNLDIRLFAAIISYLDVVVSSDSLAMHLGIALKKKVIALFGPTASQEVDLYGLGEKLKLDLECSPCYRAWCPEPRCMLELRPEAVLEAVKRNL